MTPLSEGYETKYVSPLLGDDEPDTRTETRNPAPLPAEEIEADVAGLLDEIVAFVRSYVVLHVEAVHYLALFVAHTYVMDAAETTLYPYVTGPVRRIGKSRLMEVLDYLVRKPEKAVGTSEPALFRVIGEDGPTLLFDEVEALFGRNAQRDPSKQMLVSILNAGWRRRGGDVLRCVGEGSRQQVVRFPVFGPKVLVGIDVGLPDTLADRVVRIEMERRTKDEKIDKLRDREGEARGAPLRERLQRFGVGAVDELAEARPQLPDELDDRKQDGWEPLVAIADLAGGGWPARARAAALALSVETETDDASANVQLLADVRTAFGDDDRLPTKTLLDRLTADDESRWREWGRERKPLTARGLGSLLRGFKIRSRTIRLQDETTAKGYLREQFAAAWNRYLPPDLPSPSVTASQASSHAGLSATPIRQRPTDAMGRKPARTERLDGVTDGSGIPGDREAETAGPAERDDCWRCLCSDEKRHPRSGLTPVVTYVSRMEPFCPFCGRRQRPEYRVSRDENEGGEAT